MCRLLKDVKIGFIVLVDLVFSGIVVVLMIFILFVLLVYNLFFMGTVFKMRSKMIYCVVGRIYRNIYLYF